MTLEAEQDNADTDTERNGSLSFDQFPFLSHERKPLAEDQGRDRFARLGHKLYRILIVLWSSLTAIASVVIISHSIGTNPQIFDLHLAEDISKNVPECRFRLSL
jgi:hypothetical protein